MNHHQLYAAYKQLNIKAADLHHSAALLEWDQEVYMPPKSASFRAGQLATLASMAHELLTADAYGAQLQQLLASNQLSPDELANVQLSWYDYQKNCKLPSAFVQELSEQTSRSFHAWISARKANDFNLFAPELHKMVELKKQQADLYGFNHHPYNALLDDYEMGATVHMLDAIFLEVKKELNPILKSIYAAPQVNDAFLFQHFPKSKQWDFSIQVLTDMGYDFDAGRQDYSEHPFTTSFSPTDVRVTTRVSENDLSSLLWSSIHEGGHALYEQGLPQDQYGLPLGAAASLGVHESQSRLWENGIGRSLNFWQHYYPILQQQMAPALDAVSLLDFYKAINKVSPSFIRTEADEISYHFHVMIRYEIEKGLIDGSLSVAHVADVWNQNYQHYLGITPPNNLVGVLQDVHWSHGSFGYFPTYSLGSFYAAQFLNQALQTHPNLQSDIGHGNFTALLSWLRQQVHMHGRKFTSNQLCNNICGKNLDLGPFVKYIKQKYSAIYGLDSL